MTKAQLSSISTSTDKSEIVFVSPSCISLALWIRDAISWLREETSLRKSWFSRRRLEITCSWPCCCSWSWGGIIGAVWGSAGASISKFRLSGASPGHEMDYRCSKRKNHISPNKYCSYSVHLKAAFILYINIQLL